MVYKQIPELVVGDLIYFCQRLWSVIAIKPIAGCTKQTCLTLKITHLTIKQNFDDCVFVRCTEQKQDPQKISESEEKYTKKYQTEWLQKTQATFENFETLQMKRRRHSLKKRGQNDSDS
jgi:hypothetical protein